MKCERGLISAERHPGRLPRTGRRRPIANLLDDRGHAGLGSASQPLRSGQTRVRPHAGGKSAGPGRAAARRWSRRCKKFLTARGRGPLLFLPKCRALPRVPQRPGASADRGSLPVAAPRFPWRSQTSRAMAPMSSFCTMKAEKRDSTTRTFGRSRLRCASTRARPPDIAFSLDNAVAVYQLGRHAAMASNRWAAPRPQ